MGKQCPHHELSGYYLLCSTSILAKRPSVPRNLSLCIHPPALWRTLSSSHMDWFPIWGTEVAQRILQSKLIKLVDSQEFFHKGKSHRKDIDLLFLFKGAVSYNQKLRTVAIQTGLVSDSSRSGKNNFANMTHSVHAICKSIFMCSLGIWNTSLLNNEIYCICPISSHLYHIYI